MSNKKRISNLVFRKYDLPIIIENWKRRVGYYKSGEIALQEFAIEAWSEYLGVENPLGKIGDKIVLNE